MPQGSPELMYTKKKWVRYGPSHQSGLVVHYTFIIPDINCSVFYELQGSPWLCTIKVIGQCALFMSFG